MKKHNERINISELPNSLIDTVCDHIKQFSVILLRITSDKNTEHMQQIGSGTLIIINSFHSILTAEHVIAQLRSSDRLGLLSSFRGHPHRYIFDQDNLGIHRIGRGKDDSIGPDIGLIVLPRVNIGRLKAEKSFFNVDKRIELSDKFFISTDRGFWFTFGFPGEFEEDIQPRRGFAAIKGYQGLCGISGITKEYEDSGYDYLEMSIEYGIDNSDLPSSFGGVSGGGVWQVPLSKDSEGHLKPDEYILSGVIFYQTNLEANHRLIRCHGRKTVYQNVPNYLKVIIAS